MFNAITVVDIENMISVTIVIVIFAFDFDPCRLRIWSVCTVFREVKPEVNDAAPKAMC